MKKSILVVAIALATITVQAQKMKEAAIPAPVKAAFAKAYPNTKAKSWEMEDGKYEAEFEVNKVEMSVLMDASGNIKETESEIQVTALPAAVVDYCTKNYAGKKIAEASKIVDEKGVVTYEAEINKMDVLFSADGTFIKEMKD
jgi:Putative beta-lactamase-inhibitor-like, PepSY-like